MLSKPLVTTGSDALHTGGRGDFDGASGGRLCGQVRCTHQGRWHPPPDRLLLLAPFWRREIRYKGTSAKDRNKDMSEHKECCQRLEER